MTFPLTNSQPAQLSSFTCSFLSGTYKSQEKSPAFSVDCRCCCWCLPICHTPLSPRLFFNTQASPLHWCMWYMYCRWQSIKLHYCAVSSTCDDGNRMPLTSGSRISGNDTAKQQQQQQQQRQRATQRGATTKAIYHESSF